LRNVNAHCARFAGQSRNIERINVRNVQAARPGPTCRGDMSVIDSEIASQPDVWARALDLTEQARPLFGRRGERVLALGCGTSAFVAQTFAALREAAGAGETDAAYASEAPVGRAYDRVIAFSRSGTTTEIVDALGAVRPRTTRIAVTGAPGTPVGAMVDGELLLDFASDAAVVQTRFPTTTLALVRAVYGPDLDGLADAAARALAAPLPVDPEQLAHIVFLGRGWTLGLAHEAALKLREAAHVTAESYPALDYRHGPIALAGPDSLVWAIGDVPPDLLADVAATGAHVFAPGGEPLAQIVLAQRLAVATARARGLDPDHPTHLTRSVILPPAEPDSVLQGSSR
jgi:glucosamine--fructose-6-phosphate aminotransferase (isomerizing)